MIAFEEMTYHPTSEKLVKVLCDKVQNDNPLFFRVLVGYYFSVVASTMRCNIATHDRGDLPVNMFAMNLSTSGSGKGHSTNIIKNQVINQFRERFTQSTFLTLAEDNLPKLAIKRAHRKQTDPDDELESVKKEFESIGPLLFSFNEATVPAIKTLRHKLLMCDAGALNLQIDEIGLNLSGSAEALAVFLELYDVGVVEEKLKLSTADNKRKEEIFGKTPANLMMFGTPVTLLNGGKTEDEFYSLQETGFARRCIFGYSDHQSTNNTKTAEEIYDLLTDKSSVKYLEELSEHLGNLADIINVNKRLVMTKETSLVLIKYKQHCENQAATYSEHEEMKKAEISHRYFKALKLAGAYAFIDESPELTTEHLYNSIKLVEESGAAFTRILTRDKPWVKLAKYFGSAKSEVTQADMMDVMPFYKKATTSARADMLTLAISYGYKNNIIIKKTFADGIEFLRGESLKETDLNNMILAYSSDITEDYVPEAAPFDRLHELVQLPDMHWVSHHLVNGYRNNENCIAGFNLLVLDVDGETTLENVKKLMLGYKALYYTTKRHTPEVNRFRIILPLNYELKLDDKDYKEFYKSIESWLPFKVDPACSMRSKKWMTHAGHFEYADGEMFDALPFIPKTSKNETRKKTLDSQGSMDNLERWVINNTGDGNRNNMIHRYARMLMDSGMAQGEIQTRVMDLNDKLPDKLSELEVRGTIMKTIDNKMGS